MDAETISKVKSLVVQTLEDLISGETTIADAETVVRGAEYVGDLLDLEQRLERLEFKAKQTS
jgi:hypothetical protein